MGLADLLFPRTCLECKAEGSYVCNLCMSKLRSVKQICPVCERYSVDGITHVRCRKMNSLDGLIYLWPYEGIVRKAILTLKFKYAREILFDLKRYIQNELSINKLALPGSAILVPMPMYWYKKNLRGFNLVEEMGKFMIAPLGWTINKNILIRKVMRQAQSSLKGEKRKLNVQGVFTVNSDNLVFAKEHRPIILFDDVFTTGATMKEACMVLKKGGVEEVRGLTIARRF